MQTAARKYSERYDVTEQSKNIAALQSHGKHTRPLSSLYFRQCKNGAGLWEVLQLEDSYNLSDQLSVPKVRRL